MHSRIYNFYEIYIKSVNLVQLGKLSVSYKISTRLLPTDFEGMKNRGASRITLLYLINRGCACIVFHPYSPSAAPSINHQRRYRLRVGTRRG